MAPTLFYLSVLAAVSGLASARTLYNAQYAGNLAAGVFCHNWRGASVQYAGSHCHHHVIECNDLGNGHATVYSGWVPFNAEGDNPTVCAVAGGYDFNVPPTDDTYAVASIAGVKITGVAGSSSSPAPAPAPAPAHTAHTSAHGHTAKPAPKVTKTPAHKSTSKPKPKAPKGKKSSSSHHA